MSEFTPTPGTLADPETRAEAERALAILRDAHKTRHRLYAAITALFLALAVCLTVSIARGIWLQSIVDSQAKRLEKFVTIQAEADKNYQRLWESCAKTPGCGENSMTRSAVTLGGGKVLVIQGHDGKDASDHQVMKALQAFCELNDNCRGNEGRQGEKGDQGRSLHELKCVDGNFIARFDDGTTAPTGAKCLPNTGVTESEKE